MRPKHSPDRLLLRGRASSQGARSQTSYSSVVVRIAGIAFGWTLLTSELGSQVKEAEDIGRDLAFLCLAYAGPVGPEAGGGEQGLLSSEVNQTPPSCRRSCRIPRSEKSIFDAMLRALASHGYIPDRNMAWMPAPCLVAIRPRGEMLSASGHNGDVLLAPPACHDPRPALFDPKATSELSVRSPHGFFRPTETRKLRCPQWRFCKKNSPSCGGLMRVPDSIACTCPRW